MQHGSLHPIASLPPAELESGAAANPAGLEHRALCGLEHLPVDLPTVLDICSATAALATGDRRKVLIQAAGAPNEVALLREGREVLVSCYETGSAPIVHVLDHRLSLEQLIRGCLEAIDGVIASQTGAVSSSAHRVRSRLESLEIRDDVLERLPHAQLQGGVASEPHAGIALAFGFTGRLRMDGSQVRSATARADLHALLFDGELWAWSRGRRIPVARGPILLAVERMVAAIRGLLDAWEAGRAAHLRLSGQGFAVAVRLDRRGDVLLGLGTHPDELTKTVALDVPQAALPTLRLASDLVRAIVACDRRQAQNLRLGHLRDEVRSLRRLVRTRIETSSFTNRDPERLREGLRTDAPRSTRESSDSDAVRLGGRRLGFGERWRQHVEDLDAASTYFCGDRIIASSSRSVLALGRDTGELLWQRETFGGRAAMAGTSMVVLGDDGTVEFCDVADGQTYATSHLATCRTNPTLAMFAGGRSLPPLAILHEGPQRLVALDVRTGEPRWRHRVRGTGPVRLRRAGRVLLVIGGGGALSALDLTSGEEVWRFSDGVRFCLPPAVAQDVVVIASGGPSSRGSHLYGLDLYEGLPLWKRDLESAVAASPFALGPYAAIALGGGGRANLATFQPRSGELRWMTRDPGLANGASALNVDDLLVVNAPAGRIVGMEIETGEVRWKHRLADPIGDAVPRRLEPVLRAGALFVPAASVHVLRPSDGEALGPPLGGDLIPDWLRVDERGWVYVGEESGQIAALTPAPHLSVIHGGAMLKRIV